MSALALSVAAFVSTFAGGLFALRHRERLHLILGFTAGVLVGVVAFDLLPEIFELATERGIAPRSAMVALVAGFLFFHVLEKFLLVHHGHEGVYAAHTHPHVGMLSAAALIGHSVMDGVAIGFAFQVSRAMGFAVAAAVIAHDFCDGLNTMGLMLMHRNSHRRSIVMLVLDALAPIAGAAASLLFEVPPSVLLLYLGFFAGFLLYIGAADILPEAHSAARPGEALTLVGLTCAGAAFAWAITHIGH